MTAIKKLDKATALRIEWIEGSIRDLRATVQMVASDSGTHAMPGTTTVYERFDGSLYEVYKFGGSNGTRKEIESLDDVETDGYVRTFPGAKKKLAAARTEVKRLETELKRLSK